MAASLDITQEALLTEMRAFLLSQLPQGVEVIRALGNGAALPRTGFVAYTLLSATRLATNTHDYSSDQNQQAITQRTELVIQIDCYGPLAFEWAVLLTTVLRDAVGVDGLDALTPLYADDPKQLPLVNSEGQYEQRWMIELHAQINPALILSQEFFDSATVAVESTLSS